jgi:hypothetical protein
VQVLRRQLGGTSPEFQIKPLVLAVHSPHDVALGADAIVLVDDHAVAPAQAGDDVEVAIVSADEIIAWPGVDDV